MWCEAKDLMTSQGIPELKEMIKQTNIFIQVLQENVWCQNLVICNVQDVRMPVSRCKRKVTVIGMQQP